MTVLRGFGIVLLSAVLGALIGCGIGYTLGVVTPAYYRGVFSTGNSPGFDPVQVGSGLGFTQGLVAGLLVGCVVVLAVAWFNARRQVIIQDFGPRQWGQTGPSPLPASEAIRDRSDAVRPSDPISP
jgi:hypothetical protein